MVAGDAEALVTLVEPAAGAGEADRQRLERELADAERLLDAARARLANAAFLEKAPAGVVEGARASAADLQATVHRLRERLGR